MIAASEPQEFVPNGRQQLKRHPGDTVSHSSLLPFHPESFLFERFSEVAISDTAKSEWWTLRPIQKENLKYEEELYVNGRTAVWSVGSCSESNESSNHIRSCYTCETPIKHALWCTFYDSAACNFKTDQQDDPKGEPISGVCIVDSNRIQVHTEDGQEYFIPVNSEISNVWPCKYGIMFEQQHELKSPPMPGVSGDFAVSHLPGGSTLYSLQHPLHSFAPFIMKHGSNITYFDNPTLHIINVCSDLSACLIYDSKSGSHSVWKIRRILSEELNIVCPDFESSYNSASVFYRSASSGVVGSGSFHHSFGNSKFNLGASLHQVDNIKASPLSGISPHSVKSASPASVYHSPSWAGLLRSSTPSPNLHTSALGRNAFFSPAKSNNSSTSPFSTHDSRLMAGLFPEPVEQKFVCPELCLEYIWGEPSSPNKEVKYGPASKAFLTTDQLDYSYLCYLVPTRRKLLCARLEHSNEGEIIIGIISEISARDACSLPDLKLLITVDHVGSIVLYSGTFPVGKVHVGGIATIISSCSYDAAKQQGSHFFTPTCSKTPSILTSSRPQSAMESCFCDEQDNLLSPVTSLGSSRTSTNFLTPVQDSLAAGKTRALSTPRREQLVGVRDPVGSHVTLEYNDGSLFRVSLPKICSSQLVSSCLSVLKQVLKRDYSLQMIAKWYTARNSPGTQDIAPDQEWKLFITVLFELFGYEVVKVALLAEEEEEEETLDEQAELSLGPKRMRESESGTELDWYYLLRSEYHSSVVDHVNIVLNLNAPNSKKKSKKVVTIPAINTAAPLFSTIPLVLFTLHLLYEEFKMNNTMTDSLPLLATFLHQLASDLRLPMWMDHYWRDFPLQCPLQLCYESQIQESDLEKLPSYNFITQEPPSIFQTLHNLMTTDVFQKYPFIAGVNKRCKDIIQLMYLLIHEEYKNRKYDDNDHNRDENEVEMVDNDAEDKMMDGDEYSKKGVDENEMNTNDNEEKMVADGEDAKINDDDEHKMIKTDNENDGVDFSVVLEEVLTPIVPPGKTKQFDAQSVQSSRPKCNMPYCASLLMVEMGYKRADLHTFPPVIALILNDITYRCRVDPPVDWPAEAYALILREDLEEQVHQTEYYRSAIGPSQEKVVLDNREKSNMTGRMRPGNEEDGMDGMNMEILNLRFSKDHRVTEVRHMLQSSRPVKIALTQRPEVSDHEFIEEQEKHLLSVCTRTMSLPVGRGMFTLRTVCPVITETLPIPALCLTGRAPPRNTTVDLTHIEVVPNMNLWPLFHNGVAAGLRITTSAADIDSNWIVFNKPKGNSDVPPTEHAGFLMALGLNGHLQHLVKWNTYDYLVKCHEMTSVGVLLGLAASKRGTMDASTTKLMSVHVEALLPPTSLELDIPHNIQVAALLGVGLIYERTAHRHIAEVLLSEIGRPPGPEMENCIDRESYSLAAGLSLGLVVLGKGSTACGLGDLHIPDTLHYYMVGGYRRPLTGTQKEKYKSPSYQIREGESVNIDVTSPGATLAIGMMFFNTGNAAVADWMKVPDTQYLLEFCRPDFLLLRVVARSLILWDTIRPTPDWVKSHIPEGILPFILYKPNPNVPDNIDYETMSQAYCNAIAGGCMAIGLKYAGTGNKKASATLIKFAKIYSSVAGTATADLAGKSTIENCLNVVVLSAALVMAGSGDLEVLRLCRYLRSRVGPSNSVVTYGSHLATHMAIGLLFLGGGRYTLSTSPSAIAAMICAFFPKFPTHSNDNRYHLQAFRHLYVLAVEPRLVVSRDIDTKMLCLVNLTVVYLNHKEHKRITPCLLPELKRMKEVRVEDERYWPVVFKRGENWDQLEKMLVYGTFLGVKQKAGCLSYLDDPHGFRSLLAQTLTRNEATSWSISPSSILSFSSDPSLMRVTQLFLEDLEVHRKNQSNKAKDEVQILTSLTHECVTKDKLEVLPIYISVMKMLDTLEKNPSVRVIWQFKLLHDMVLSKKRLLAIKTFDPDFALPIYQLVRRIFDTWEEGLEPLVASYIAKHNVGNDRETQKLPSYLVYNDFPQAESLAQLLNELKHKERVQKTSTMSRTMQKLQKYLKYFDE